MPWALAICPFVTDCKVTGGRSGKAKTIGCSESNYIFENLPAASQEGGVDSMRPVFVKGLASRVLGFRV